MLHTPEDKARSKLTIDIDSAELSFETAITIDNNKINAKHVPFCE